MGPASEGGEVGLFAQTSRGAPSQFMAMVSAQANKGRLHAGPSSVSVSVNHVNCCRSSTTAEIVG